MECRRMRIYQNHLIAIWSDLYLRQHIDGNRSLTGPEEIHTEEAREYEISAWLRKAQFSSFSGKGPKQGNGPNLPRQENIRFCLWLNSGNEVSHQPQLGFERIFPDAQEEIRPFHGVPWEENYTKASHFPPAVYPPRPCLTQMGLREG